MATCFPAINMSVACFLMLSLGLAHGAALFCLHTCNISNGARSFRLVPTSRMSCSSCCLLSKTPRLPVPRRVTPPLKPRTRPRRKMASRCSALLLLPRPALPSVRIRSPPSQQEPDLATRAGRTVTGAKILADTSRSAGLQLCFVYTHSAGSMCL